MNGLEEQVLEFLDSTISRDENKDRDISLILDYYGFSEDILPTLDEISQRHKINSRQRVNQIIQEKFKSRTSFRKNPIIKICCENFNVSSARMVSQQLYSLVSRRIISKDYHPANLYRLLSELELCDDVQLLTPELHNVTRSNVFACNDLILARTDEIEGLNSKLTEILKFPSNIGIASLADLKFDRKVEDLMQSIISNINESWTYEFDSKFWFLFEHRSNRLINLLKKTFQIGEKCPIERLAQTLENAFHSRTPPQGQSFPSSFLIQQYLQSSKFTSIENNEVSYLGDRVNLSDIEKAIQEYYVDHISVSFTDIKTYLGSQNFGDASIVKNVNNSPLVFVDKSRGRGRYTYSLAINSQSLSKNLSRHDERYEEFRNKLKSILRIGTDSTSTTKVRREQSILSDWIFGDNETEKCAICHHEYETKALICAHKKPRSMCTESERTDPYIVIPLCVFGCDYLYEHRYCTIKNGEVTQGNPLPEHTHSSHQLNQIVRNKLDNRWLMGPDSYFDLPPTLF